MLRRIVHTIVVIAVTTAVLAAAGPAAAQPNQPPTPTERLSGIIGNITAWIVGMLLGVGTLFLTYGGARRMTANGDPTQIEKANSIIKNGLLGYALAILAPVLLAILQGWIEGS